MAKKTKVICPDCGKPMKSERGLKMHQARHCPARKHAPAPTPPAPEVVPDDEVTEESAPAVEMPEPVPARVTKPDPPRPPLPVVLGTTLPGAYPATVERYDSPDRAVAAGALPEALKGIVLDIWIKAHQHALGIRRIDDETIALRYPEGCGTWLEGKDGHYAQILGMGPHPFGLTVLVISRRTEPWVLIRAPYRHDGEPVLGEMWITPQHPDTGEWTKRRWGNARHTALRWDRAVPPEED